MRMCPSPGLTVRRRSRIMERSALIPQNSAPIFSFIILRDALSRLCHLINDIIG